jgi:hypothetical protein
LVLGANAQAVHSADLGLGTEKLIMVGAAASKNNEVDPRPPFFA